MGIISDLSDHQCHGSLSSVMCKLLIQYILL
jgi:hypothetical protein